MARPRFVDADVAEALDRAVRGGEIRRLLRVVFPVADTTVAVAHGLQADPSSVGRRIIRANAHIIDAPGEAWTYDLAFLQADAGGAEAWIEFFVLQGELDTAPLEADIVPGSSGGGGGVTDHGALTGLSDDDHPQYAREYVHTQSSSASTWTVNHNLGYQPVVAVLDSSGAEVVAEVTHASVNQLTVSFASAQTGAVRCV